MAANPFTPVSGTVEVRMAHAAEYQAYYLGEIANQLGRIAGSLQNENGNSTRIAQSLQGIQHILPQMGR